MRKPLWSRELLKRKKILRLELFVIVLVIVIIFINYLLLYIVGIANWLKSWSRPMGHYTW